MTLLVTFGIGRILYSLIERRDKWFVFTEIIFSIVFISIGLLVLRIDQDGIRGTLLGLSFMVTGILPRVILPRHPIEAGGELVKESKRIVSVGIIDFVWLCIMGGTLAFIGFAIGVSPFSGPIPLRYASSDYYQKMLDTVIFLLGKTIDSVFLLGAVLAGCMAILWAGEIWRKSDEKSLVKYKVTTVVAIKMVFAYFFVIFGALYWIGIPLYERMIELLELLKN